MRLSTYTTDAPGSHVGRKRFPASGQPSWLWHVLLAITLVSASLGCTATLPPDEARVRQLASENAKLSLADHAAKKYPPEAQNLFEAMDGTRSNGSYQRLSLEDHEVVGRNAWMIWTGGNEAFWDWLARHGYGTIDLLKLIDSRHRGTQFATTGIITEPGMRLPTEAETRAAHGIRFARPINADYSDYSNNNMYRSMYERIGALAEGDQVATYDPAHSKATQADPASPSSNAAAYADSAQGPYGSHQPPDPYVYGYSSGIVGLRLFPNPEFSPSAARRFSAQRYYDDPAYASNPTTIRPFRVGMACSFCHVGPHPLNPPQEVEFPKWENLSSTIGAQYLRVRGAFGGQLEPDNYFYHVLDSQMPGTIDTSLIAADNINNANTMNAIFGLAARVRRAQHNPQEQLSPESAIFPGLWQGPYPKDLPTDIAAAKHAYEGNPRAVPRVLVDGSDSVGSWIALARVYLNIGSYHQRWIQTHNTILGFRDQTPFTLASCEAHSVYWHATKLRVDPMTAFFLKSSTPMKLKDAPEGIHLGWPDLPPKETKFYGQPLDDALALGRRTFAKGCIACHSSIQPGTLSDLESKIQLAELPQDRQLLTLNAADLATLTRGTGKLPDLYAQWATLAVEQEEFWRDNFMSTDLRIPVTLTGTNSARAMGSNAKHGEIWEDFASLTYKELKSVGEISFRDPFSKTTQEFTAPAGGPGYYRVPSLISAWATAPFLHNNALGIFNNDPSVKGRLDAYHDAMQKLLTPSLRLSGHDRAALSNHEVIPAEQSLKDGGLVWRTSAESYIVIRGHQIPGLVAGLTGWSPFWVQFIVPWFPSLFLFALGVLWLGSRSLERFKSWLQMHFPKTAAALWPFRWLASLLLMLSAALVLLLIWRFRPMLSLVEVSSGWLFPWIQTQTVVPAFVLAAFGLLLVFDALPLKHFMLKWSSFGGMACFVLGVFLGLGAGRALSGHGGDIRIGPLPQGTPVNLIANMDPDAPRKKQLAAIHALSRYLSNWHNAPMDKRPGLVEFENEVAPSLQAASKCPDLVLDRGHDYEFMQHFTEAEKAALIELVKTF